MMSTLNHLECSLCGKQYEAGQLLNLCDCGGPLLARYNLDEARRSWNRAWIPNGPASMWRYSPLLPVRKRGSLVSLGEGFTPLIRCHHLEQRLGIHAGHTTPDGLFSIEEVQCLAACDQAPLMVVNEDLQKRITLEEIDKWIDETHAKKA